MNKLRFLNNEEYREITARGQKRPIKVETGYEIHHIVPKSLGGNNDISNLTKLTVLEHIQVHYILAELDIPFMKQALLRMLTGSQWVDRLQDEDRKVAFQLMPNLSKYFEKTTQFLIRSRNSKSYKVSMGRKSASLRKKFIYRSEDFQNWFREQQAQGNFLGDAVWEKAVNVYLESVSKTLWDFPEAEEAPKPFRISSRSARARERYIYREDPEFRQWMRSTGKSTGYGKWNSLVRNFLADTGRKLEDYPEFTEKVKGSVDKEHQAQAIRMHRCMRTVRISKEFQDWFRQHRSDRYCARIADVADFLVEKGKVYLDYKETDKVEPVPEGMSKSEERKAKQLYTQNPEFVEWYEYCIQRGKKFVSKYQAVTSYLKSHNLQLPRVIEG